MTFLKCSIGGVKFGNVTQEDKEKEQIVATGEFNPVQKQASQESTQPSPVRNLNRKMSMMIVVYVCMAYYRSFNPLILLNGTSTLIPSLSSTTER